MPTTVKRPTKKKVDGEHINPLRLLSDAVGTGPVAFPCICGKNYIFEAMLDISQVGEVVIQKDTKCETCDSYYGEIRMNVKSLGLIHRILFTFHYGKQTPPKLPPGIPKDIPRYIPDVNRHARIVEPVKGSNIAFITTQFDFPRPKKSILTPSLPVEIVGTGRVYVAEYVNRLGIIPALYITGKPILPD